MSQFEPLRCSRHSVCVLHTNQGTPLHQLCCSCARSRLPLWLALGATLAVNLQSPDHWSLPLVFIAGLALGGVVLRRHLRRRAEAYRPTLVL